MLPRPLFLLSLPLAAAVVAAPAPLPFETTTVEYREIAQEQTFDATIEAVNRSTVSAQTAGQVVEVYFDVDDYVPKDGVLLQLKDTEHKARLAQAEAALGEARARAREAGDQHARLRELFADKHVSRADMDRARTELDTAEARLDAAEAGLKQAREQLHYTVIKAPYSGIVVTRHIEPGEAVNPGQPLMTGFSLEHLRAVTVVPQNIIGAVRDQARGRIFVPGKQPRILLAEKLTFTPYADPLTHTFKVRVDLPAGEMGIYPGSFVKVGFVTGREKVLLIPAVAVAYRSEVRGVYTVDDQGGVSLRQVRIGRTHDDLIEILAGLDAGDRIALDPVRAATYRKQSGPGAK